MISNAAGIDAQSLTDRITRQAGTVRMSFAPRAGVCGDGGVTIYADDGRTKRTIHVRGSTFSNTTTDRFAEEWQPHCVSGPVRIAMTVENGTIRSLRPYVGGEWPGGSPARDLGRIPSAEAAQGLLKLAESATGSTANEILFAASLADSVDIAHDLLAMAKNERINADARKAAVFHLGSAAAAAATRGLREIALDPHDNLGVREAAVFSLSRLPPDQGIPALIELVKNSREARIRRSAIFWLSRSGDPRAIRLFEELLIARR